MYVCSIKYFILKLNFLIKTLVSVLHRTQNTKNECFTVYTIMKVV